MLPIGDKRSGWSISNSLRTQVPYQRDSSSIMHSALVKPASVIYSKHSETFEAFEGAHEANTV